VPFSCAKSVKNLLCRQKISALRSAAAALSFAFAGAQWPIENGHLKRYPAAGHVSITRLCVIGDIRNHRDSERKTAPYGRAAVIAVDEYWSDCPVIPNAWRAQVAIVDVRTRQKISVASRTKVDGAFPQVSPCSASTEISRLGYPFVPVRPLQSQ
jgi:hypothetical protein